MVNVEIKYNENNWINIGLVYCEWNFKLISFNFSVIWDLFYFFKEICVLWIINEIINII